eukprot:3590151-Pyramimonas_sp.AAC.1
MICSGVVRSRFKNSPVGVQGWLWNGPGPVQKWRPVGAFPRLCREVPMQTWHKYCPRGGQARSRDGSRVSQKRFNASP